MTNARLDCVVAPAAQAALDRLGRTEDVTFSPRGRRLAIAGFRENRIAIFELAVVASDGRTRIIVSGVLELEASTLRDPHGLCFLDEDIVAVANCGGGVHVYAVPPARGAGATRIDAEPTATISGGTLAPTHTPGSLAVWPLDANNHELLVCNNSMHVVTRHVLDRRLGHASVHDDVLLWRRLDLPDGVCFSRDGTWIAISNRNTHEVFVYRRRAALNPESEPDAVLRNVMGPHGLRFTGDGRHLLVADAHARYVNVYERGSTGWKGVRDPVRMVPVLDWRTYLEGRSNPQDGGPKGIDFDPGMRVMVCTTEHQPLAFFDLAALLSDARARPENHHMRRIRWRLADAIHRRSPSAYDWLRPFWR